MDRQPGRRIGHYRLLRKIGQGGMGEVWEALDSSLNRKVALKFLPTAVLERPNRLERFVREAQALAAFTHPNIVTIHSIENVDGIQFFTMELIQGPTLSEVIPGRGLPFERFLSLAVPLTEAIATAHQNGVIHRDLKPGNVMLTREGRVKVLDFGLSRSLSEAAREVSADAATWTSEEKTLAGGTVPFMSPEQLRSQPLDPRADLFSLGVVFYQMVTGRLPFQARTVADLVATILRDEPRPVTELNPVLPSRVWTIVQRCLEKDPDRRFQSARELLEELRALQLDRSKTAAGPSVAVLPFTDLSPEGGQEHLCEGIAEEIRNALSKIRELHVASRASTLRLKSHELSPQEVGQGLGVSRVLDGSVRKAEDRLRINVDLIDVEDGVVLWTERYDRQLPDLFQLQDEIAAQVVHALHIALEQDALPGSRVPQTSSIEAYDYYLRGRKLYFQYRRKGVELALDMFVKAIELDPEYSRAHAGLADCYSFLYLYADRSQENLNGAERSSRRALDLDPQSAEAQASRGQALSINQQDNEAVKAFEAAIRLDPRLFEAHYFYGRHCFSRGQRERALQLFEQANAARPEDHSAPLLVAQIYEDLERFAEAEISRRRGLRLAEDYLRNNPDDSRAWYMGANALVSLDEVEEGLRWANRALSIEPDDAMLLYNLGCIKSLAGRTDEALDHLEGAVDRGLLQKGWFDNDSNLDPLRPTSRFKALMEKLEALETACKG